ncbi:MAG: hypothetical protein Q9220_002463 [cf. Caloplaca sp. 1 TL-2023]
MPDTLPDDSSYNTGTLRIRDLMGMLRLSNEDFEKAMRGKFTPYECWRAWLLELPQPVIDKFDHYIIDPNAGGPTHAGGIGDAHRIMERATNGATKTNGGKWGSGGMYAIVALLIAVVVISLGVIGYRVKRRRVQKRKKRAAAAMLQDSEAQGDDAGTVMNNTAANDFAQVNRREVADGMGGL